MTSALEAGTRELTWRYPEREGQPFVLRDDGAEIGWLQFHEEPIGSTGELRGKRWIFRYSAGLRPRVTVYGEDSQDVVAEYAPSLAGGGVASFHSGVCYRWRKTTLWGDKWCFCHREQRSAVCVSQEAGPLKQGGKVSVCCGAVDLAETPVLLLLAWFLRIMDFEMLVEGIFGVG